MRSHVLLVLAAAAALGACGGRGRLSDNAPAHTPPRRADVVGDWVLGTDPDSTGAFAGAQTVALSISATRFTLTATYPTGEPWVVTGTASMTGDGALLRLVPETNNRAVGGAAVPMTPGRPLEWLAGAADNTMVFADAQGTLARPTSVWHRRDAAAAAGLITTKSVGGAVSADSTKGKP
jgi:hypothetical protein